jgi:hypothetical protein
MPLLFLLFALSAGAQKEPEVLRFGTLATILSGDDMAQIRQLSARTGGEIWFVSGDIGRAGGLSVAVYRRPEVAQGAVRTGVLLVIATKGVSRRTWAVSSAASYAQVLLPGRAPDAIEGYADPNRPFRVTGQWNADELAELVTFIRSSPKSSAAKGLRQVNGAQPIELVARQGSVVEIRLRVDANQYHVVSLTRVDGSWVVASIGHLIVD